MGAGRFEDPARGRGHLGANPVSGDQGDSLLACVIDVEVHHIQRSILVVAVASTNTRNVFHVLMCRSARWPCYGSLIDVPVSTMVVLWKLMAHPEPAEPNWTFLSNHAHVLLCIAQETDLTIRALSDRVGITERAVQRILSELQQAGYVDKRRSGRRNCYVVDGDRPLRHPLEAHQNIGALIRLITRRPRSSGRRRDPAPRTGGRSAAPWKSRSSPVRRA